MPDSINDSSARVNYIFVDFENVRKIDLSIIGNKVVHFTLLLGSQDKKLDVSVVEKLLEHVPSVQLVRLKSAGNNALDFALAYYVGRAVVADATANFHIISKDTGYDALVEHLRSNNIEIRRHNGFDTLPMVVFKKAAVATVPTLPQAPSQTPMPPKQAKAKPQTILVKPTVRSLATDKRVIQIIEHLRKSPATSPKTKFEFVSLILAHLGHKISEADALKTFEDLQGAGHISVSHQGGIIFKKVSK